MPLNFSRTVSIYHARVLARRRQLRPRHTSTLATYRTGLYGPALLDTLTMLTLSSSASPFDRRAHTELRAAVERKNGAATLRTEGLPATRCTLGRGFKGLPAIWSTWGWARRHEVRWQRCGRCKAWCGRCECHCKACARSSRPAAAGALVREKAPDREV